MKIRIAVLGLIPFLISCAAFKQLQPDPEVIPAEGAYIEIQDDGDPFELDKDKKYYIEFPAPPANNFYLLIDVTDRDKIVSALADRFDKDKGILSRVQNEASSDANEAAYPVSSSVQKFYWVIENVYKDELLLDLNYRYLPQWRYKFETQYESFQNILAENKVDRLTYENIGGSVSLNDLNFSRLLSELEEKTGNLESLFLQLASIEKLFPASILNSSDEAYQNYLTLKEDIDLELTFQKNYTNALMLFESELKTRNDMPAFAQSIPGFLEFYQHKDRYPNNIINEANRVFDARLDELTPFYEEHIRKKNDFEPIDLNVDNVNELYNVIGSTKPGAYKQLASFVEDYNNKAHALSETRSNVDDIRRKVSSYNKWPDNSYFSGVSQQVTQFKKKLPSAGFRQHKNFSSAKCSKLLNNAIHSLHSELIRVGDEYKRANGIVSQLNRYASSKSYRQMIQLINRNKALKFLPKMYSSLDEKSLSRQKSLIKSALKTQDWRGAEEGLRSLHLNNDFLKLQSIKPKKRIAVKAMEDTLLNRVERVTRQKVNAFVAAKYVEVNDVEGLYSDPVFKAAWDITFTSGSQNDLKLRKQKLNGRLKSLKEIEFPAKAIKALYKDFTKNINNNGVLKARAIVTHGQHYKGDDRKLKTLVGECDPSASKWITKQGDFRKVYALPTTNNPTGENTYVVKINFRIPTDAYFATWDVNVKLPKEVAKDAGSSSWYEKMTMNKKLLKAEGRFTITAPSEDNNYTALIAPLEVVKDGDSVFEVHFKHNSLKVFEVSINAQEPILRKN
ncbi:MAG: hypothetical protein D8M58_13425 [Calditrichaeota bacterium]|nr:hypothetical protein [Calditrichota bacterium]